MGRLIDADALKDALDYIDYGQHQYDLTMEAIDSAPTIEEPIKCKDCIWWTKADASLQGRCSMFGIYPTGTWFCANAERKEGADNE